MTSADIAVIVSSAIRGAAEYYASRGGTDVEGLASRLAVQGFKQALALEKELKVGALAAHLDSLKHEDERVKLSELKAKDHLTQIGERKYSDGENNKGF